MIGVCIPAHNEEAFIDRCLSSVTLAARHPGLGGEPVQIVVVQDDCSDGTAERVARWEVLGVEISHRNVGLARAVGAQHLLAAGARWLAFTDADTSVSEAWLVHQLSFGTDVVCGTVDVSDWESHGTQANAARAHFLATYQDRDGHRHVHGANLGIDAQTYQRIGGFEALICSEDQDLIDRLQAACVSIAWTALPRVMTSARPYSRVNAGFAAALRKGWCQEQRPSINPQLGDQCLIMEEGNRAIAK
ncbi:MAG: glycosyltransferase family 2 protein [Burkholderiaceae bacterium]